MCKNNRKNTHLKRLMTAERGKGGGGETERRCGEHRRGADAIKGAELCQRIC